jgi:hypothetical protein
MAGLVLPVPLGVAFETEGLVQADARGRCHGRVRSAKPAWPSARARSRHAVVSARPTPRPWADGSTASMRISASPSRATSENGVPGRGM